MKTNSAVVLKPKRDKPVRQRHPWIFSGGIKDIPVDAVDGDVVDVTDNNGLWLARGLLNRSSQIQVRLLTWEPDELIDDDFWRRRITNAIQLRRAHHSSQSLNHEHPTALRLIHAESDFLPGLTVDQYGEYLSIQIGSLGIELRKKMLAALLLELTGCKGVIDRSDGAQRRKERIQPSTDVLIAGQLPPQPVTIWEDGLQFQADLISGQKTGFYLDQRENRQRIAHYCSNKSVLNTFSYTGAFAVHALRHGANHVTNVDTSYQALTQAEENLHANGFTNPAQSELIAGDVFEVLRDWRDAASSKPSDGNSDDDHADQFDVIILDPPKFAHSAGQVEKALRGYKDINMLAIQLSKPNGILATFSCSGLVSADLFQKVLFGAAVDAGRELQILEHLRQPFDHPTAITFPEGSYLKGFICRVI